VDDSTVGPAMSADVSRDGDGGGAALNGDAIARSEEVLTAQALEFVEDLERTFRPSRDELLRARLDRRRAISRGDTLRFLPETAEIRDSQWVVAAAPGDLRDRRVEITGPTDRKMAINALNSGAQVWLADFEDANSPTWANLVSGQVNLVEAIEGTISLVTDEGRSYRLETEHPATIVVRPRGWHLDESHVVVGGRPITGALFDFGIYFYNNVRRLLQRGSGPYFYLPKMESHLEARLWNEVFVHSQQRLGIPVGTIRATVLIETIPAAFEMEEILFELRDHASGLNAGRWDYLFSMIKYFRDAGSDYVLPDRNSITMTAPMMRAYTELLVRTCHRRGASAIGGMAAFVPSRRDAAVNEKALAQVALDKEREAGDGFDGSWVAHPDLVPICRKAFDAVLGDRPNQIERLREDVEVTEAQLLDVRSTPGAVTEQGLHNDTSVALQYIESWLRGVGAAAIFNLMEDVATAEIARSQVWQWLHNGVKTSDGSIVTEELVRSIVHEELEKISSAVGGEAYGEGRWNEALSVFEDVAMGEEFVEFLTSRALPLLEA
jgi:malate synthase